MHDLIRYFVQKKIFEHLYHTPSSLEKIATIFKLEQLGYKGKIRQTTEGKNYTTDNGNYIYDIKFNKPIQDPEKENEKINQIPGVIETGFFFNLASRVIIGQDDGSVVIRS